MRTIKDLDGEWTRFNDMLGGGTQKTEWSTIFIQADVEDATRYLNFKYRVHPNTVTCCCCGSDFSTTDGNALTVFRFDFAKYGENYWESDRERYLKLVESGDTWTFTFTKEELLERVIKHVNEPDERRILIVFADEMGEEYKDHYVWEPYDDCYENDDWF